MKKAQLAKLSIIVGLVCLIIALLRPSMQLSACTTFFLQRDAFKLVAKNLDWDFEEGLIYVNKRQSAKTALMVDPVQHGQPAGWIAQYGSVTFNQHGREMPMGGMNEAGLVVEALFLDGTRYPKRDQRLVVRALQWVQYQLDMHSSVAEVIASDHQIRIRPTRSSGHHFLVADASGDCATIEFIDGEMVYHRGESLPVKALTNSTYDNSLHYWNKGRGPLFDTYDSVWRFMQAAQKLQDYDPIRPAIDYAFDILALTGPSEYTRWRIVYDIPNRHVYFRTHGHKAIRHFDLKAFDFSCTTPVKQLNIQARLEGDVSRQFIDYDYSVNTDLLTKIYRNTRFMSHFPEGVLEIMARPPADVPCVQDTVDRASCSVNYSR